MKNEDDTRRIYTISMAQIHFIPVIAAVSPDLKKKNYS